MSDFSAFSDDKHLPFIFKGTAEKVAVLVHGFPGTPYEMRMVGEILQDYGYTVHGLLLPGFGPEIQNLATKHRKDWINAIKFKLEEVRKDTEETLLMGYSFGGALTINLIHDFPELTPDKFILIAPFWNVFAQYNFFVRLFGPLVWPIGRLFSPDIRVYENVNFDDPDQRKDLEEAFDGIDLDNPEVRKFLKTITLPFSIIDEVYKLGKSAKQGMSSLKTNIMVIQGSNDKIVTPKATKSLIDSASVEIIYHEIPEKTHEFIKPNHNNKAALIPLFKKFLE